MHSRQWVGQPRCSTSSRGSPNGKSKPPIHACGWRNHSPKPASDSIFSSRVSCTRPPAAWPIASTIGLRRVGVLEKSQPSSIIPLA
jgi:hypothetical protein